VSAVVVYFQVTFFIVDEGKSVVFGVYATSVLCRKETGYIGTTNLSLIFLLMMGIYKKAPDFHFNEFPREARPGIVLAFFVLYASSSSPNSGH